MASDPNNPYLRPEFFDEPQQGTPSRRRRRLLNPMSREEVGEQFVDVGRGLARGAVGTLGSVAREVGALGNAVGLDRLTGRSVDLDRVAETEDAILSAIGETTTGSGTVAEVGTRFGGEAAKYVAGGGAVRAGARRALTGLTSARAAARGAAPEVADRALRRSASRAAAEGAERGLKAGARRAGRRTLQDAAAVAPLDLAVANVGGTHTTAGALGEALDHEGLRAIGEDPIGRAAFEMGAGALIGGVVEGAREIPWSRAGSALRRREPRMAADSELTPEETADLVDEVEPAVTALPDEPVARAIMEREQAEAELERMKDEALTPQQRARRDQQIARKERKEAIREQTDRVDALRAAEEEAIRQAELTSPSSDIATDRAAPHWFGPNMRELPGEPRTMADVPVGFETNEFQMPPDPVAEAIDPGLMDLPARRPRRVRMPRERGPRGAPEGYEPNAPAARDEALDVVEERHLGRPPRGPGVTEASRALETAAASAPSSDMEMMNRIAMGEPPLDPIAAAFSQAPEPGLIEPATVVGRQRGRSTEAQDLDEIERSILSPYPEAGAMDDAELAARIDDTAAELRAVPDDPIQRAELQDRLATLQGEMARRTEGAPRSDLRTGRPREVNERLEALATRSRPEAQAEPELPAAEAADEAPVTLESITGTESGRLVSLAARGPGGERVEIEGMHHPDGTLEISSIVSDAVGMEDFRPGASWTRRMGREVMRLLDEQGMPVSRIEGDRVTGMRQGLETDDPRIRLSRSAKRLGGAEPEAAPVREAEEILEPSAAEERESARLGTSTVTARVLPEDLSDELVQLYRKAEESRGKYDAERQHERSRRTAGLSGAARRAEKKFADAARAAGYDLDDLNTGADLYRAAAARVNPDEWSSTTFVRAEEPTAPVEEPAAPEAPVEKKRRRPLGGRLAEEHTIIRTAGEEDIETAYNQTWEEVEKTIPAPKLKWKRQVDGVHVADEGGGNLWEVENDGDRADPDWIVRNPDGEVVYSGVDTVAEAKEIAIDLAREAQIRRQVDLRVRANPETDPDGWVDVDEYYDQIGAQAGNHYDTKIWPNGGANATMDMEIRGVKVPVRVGFETLPDGSIDTDYEISPIESSYEIDAKYRALLRGEEPPPSQADLELAAEEARPADPVAIASAVPDAEEIQFNTFGPIFRRTKNGWRQVAKNGTGLTGKTISNAEIDVFRRAAEDPIYGEHRSRAAAIQDEAVLTERARGLRRKARTLAGAGSPAADLAAKEASAFADEATSRGIILDEAGAVDPRVVGALARAGLGAAAGITQGDTPEERVRNALLGSAMLLGAPSIVRRARRAMAAADDVRLPSDPGVDPRTPSAKAQSAAQTYGERYRATHGLDDFAIGGQYERVPEREAYVLADLVDQMPDDPTNPRVVASYTALKREVLDQWNHLTENGFVFEPWVGEGQPYANSTEAIADLENNQHLYFFLTKDGFGEEGIGSFAAHPLAQLSGIEVAGEPLYYNDLFRAVHDAMGHGVDGNQFGPRGEHNAWIAHARMFSEQARMALAMETRTQNSWVNYGRHLRRPDGTTPKRGDPDFIPLEDRPFADQKVFELPDWLIHPPGSAAHTRAMQALDMPLTEGARQLLRRAHGVMDEVIHSEIGAVGNIGALKRQHTLLPHLLVKAPEVPTAALRLTGKMTRGNFDKNVAVLDRVADRYPRTTTVEEWNRMAADALGTEDVPIPPYQGLRYIANPDLAVERLANMTAGQIKGRVDGFAMTKRLGQHYANGTATPVTSGKLLLWGSLSKQVTPSIQEAGFIDSIEAGIEPYLQAAAEGRFDDKMLADYLRWAGNAMPEGSLGAATQNNLNAFGRDLLATLGRVDENGEIGMLRVHQLLADRTLSSQEARRRFLTEESVGIDAKVFSFIQIISGRRDVMVLDRVQVDHMFNDGRYDDYNLYAGTSSKQGPKNKPMYDKGSGLQELVAGPKGLLYYEALERQLGEIMPYVYTKLRERNPDFARLSDGEEGVSDFHWDSWVLQSAQEVDHATAAGMVRELDGEPAPYRGLAIRNGKYDEYGSMSEYFRAEDGTPRVRYSLSDGSQVVSDPITFRDLFRRLRLDSRRKNPQLGVVPSGFRVSEQTSAPWFEAPEVNRTALDSYVRSWAEGAGDAGERAGTDVARTRRRTATGIALAAALTNPAALQAQAGAVAGAAAGDEEGDRLGGALLGAGILGAGAAGVRSMTSGAAGRGARAALNGLGFVKADNAVDAVEGFVRRNMTSAGDLPPEVFKSKIRNNGWIEGQINQVSHAVRDFESAAKEAYGGVDRMADADIDLIDAALKGNAPLSSLPPAMQPVVTEMRTHIDALSRRLISDGVIQGPLAATVEANLGVYAKRAYRIFDDPDWPQNVPEPVRNRAVAYLRQEYPNASQHEINRLIGELLMRGEDGPIAMMSKGRLGSKAMKHLTERKDIHPTIRALWGEYGDARINYAKSVASMSQLIGSHGILQEARTAGLGRFFIDPKSADPFERGENLGPELEKFTAEIAADGSKAMAPLNGLYTTPEIAKAFESTFDPQSTGGLLRMYMKANGTVKVAKTVFSPQAQIRNLIGNIGFAVANGHTQGGKMASAFRTVLNELGATNYQQFRDRYKRYLELGIVNTSTTEGEIRDIVKDASKQGIGYLTSPIATRPAKLIQATSKVYRASDDLWKIFAFENEAARYREAYPNWTPSQIEDTVAEIVRNTYPNYDMVPNAIKALRRIPLVGTFTSFPAEVVRTGYHTLSQAAKELADPATRTIGLQRAAGILAAATMTGAAAITSRQIVGVSRDEEEDMRRYMPAWDKNSQLFHLSKDDRGNHRFINMGYTDPYSYVKEAALTLLSGGDWESKLVETGWMLLEPFFGEEILAGRLADVARNTKKDTGGEVYNPQADPVTKFAESALYVAEAFEPGALTQARRVTKGLTGEQSPSGRVYNAPDEIAAIATGQRRQAVDVRQGLGFKARDYQEGVQNAQRIINRTLTNRSDLSENDILDAYAETERSRRRLFEDMHEDAMAALRMGVPRREVAALLQQGGLSKTMVGQVLRGTYVPYLPSEQFREVMQRSLTSTATGAEERRERRDTARDRLRTLRRAHSEARRLVREE